VYYFCMCTASLSVVYILSVCLSAMLANKRVHYCCGLKKLIPVVH